MRRALGMKRLRTSSPLGSQSLPNSVDRCLSEPRSEGLCKGGNRGELGSVPGTCEILPPSDPVDSATGSSGLTQPLAVMSSSSDMGNEDDGMAVGDDSPQLYYDHWNCDGLDENKITQMMPYWEGSSLIFLQEINVDPKDEDKISAIAQTYGYQCIFNSSIPCTSKEGFKYGICLMFKDVMVTRVQIKQRYPDVVRQDPFRIMMVEVKTELADEPVDFISLYFPSHDPKKSSRKAERQEWLTTVDQLCGKLKDRLVVLLGDLNCQARKPGKTLDYRSRLWDQFEAVFEDNEFLNTSKNLWKADVYTRHGRVSAGGYSYSTLDYIVTSTRMQVFNQTARPLYESNLQLSDHVGVKGSNRRADSTHPPILNAPKMECDPPDIQGHFNAKKCPVCGYVSKSPASLIIHIRRHTGHKPFVCELGCGIRFVDKGQLNKHHKICTGKRKLSKYRDGTLQLLKCCNCEYTVYTKDLLDQHQTKCIQIKQQKYYCPPCAYTTNVTNSWNRHVASEKHARQGLIEYTCKPCNYATSMKPNYDEHLQTKRHQTLSKK